jgi:hypothetical protein
VSRIPRALRVGGLFVALALILGVTLAGAASAGNQTTYNDAAGDNQHQSSTYYASDIRSVVATSADNGAARIAVTLVDVDGRMVAGDELGVYVNIDRKSSTGDQGYDYELLALGQSSGQPNFDLCSLASPVTCQAGSSGFGAETYPSTGTHVITFNTTTSSCGFDFFVRSSYQSGSGPTVIDDAPNSAAYTFNANNDPDHDGVCGDGDACPTTLARGIYDSNHNGCPGPFGRISANRHFVAGVSSSGFQLKKLFFDGAIPAGAKVQISSASRGETLTALKGFVRSRRFHGAFRFGTVITVRMTKPGYVGFYAQYVVTHSGLASRRSLCIPATGKQSPVRCTGGLRGK